MKVGIVSDHRGYELKEYLKENLKNYEVIDYGTFKQESVDYPDFAFKLGTKVKNGEVEFGIAICGSGIGISIACNKVKKVRCAKVSTSSEAKYTREDNDANIIALSASEDFKNALDMVLVFLQTKFSNEERHERRIKKIADYEDGLYEC